VHARALEGGATGARLAEVWSDLVDLPRRAEAINLDRGDILYSVIGQLKAAV
jgi:DNA polymerase-3 subunit delta'